MNRYKADEDFVSSIFGLYTAIIGFYLQISVFILIIIITIELFLIHLIFYPLINLENKRTQQKVNKIMKEHNNEKF